MNFIRFYILHKKRVVYFVQLATLGHRSVGHAQRVTGAWDTLKGSQERGTRSKGHRSVGHAQRVTGAWDTLRGSQERGTRSRAKDRGRGGRGQLKVISPLLVSDTSGHVLWRIFTT